MSLPVLMLVTDRGLCGGIAGLVRQIEAAIDGGANAVQVREKDLGDDELLALTRRIVGVAAGRAVVTVNGPPAVALAADAAGVHGGEGAAPVAEQRRALGDSALIGRSVHGLAGAIAAAETGADYLVLGTIFPSRSHPGGETGGLARVREVAHAVRVPVIAIGGLTAANAADVIGAGAAGVAVIAAILGRPDTRAAAAELRSALENAFLKAQKTPPRTAMDVS